MWWKIYFWIYAILTGLGIVYYLQLFPFSLYDSITLLSSLLLVFITYCFVYKKNFINKNQWRLIFFLIVLLIMETIVELFILPKDFVVSLLGGTELPLTTPEHILSWVISLPAVYASYKLSK